MYDVSREDEAELDRWESTDTGLYRKTKVRVATMTGELLVWTYVLDAFEGGLPSASYLGIIAAAAEAADAPADYVNGPAAASLPLDRPLTRAEAQVGPISRTGTETSVTAPFALATCTATVACRALP